MKFEIPVALVVTLLLNACAFKEPQKAPGGAPPVSAPGPRLSFDFDGPGGALAPQTMERGISAHGDGDYLSDSPFLLPEVLPTVLHGKIFIPGFNPKRTPSFRFNLQAGGSNKVFTGELTQVDNDASKETIRFELPIPKEISEITSEVQIEGDIEILSDGIKRQSSKVHFSFLTPPSKLKATHFVSRNFEKQFGPIADSLRAFRSSTFSANLVQVIQISSSSIQDVVVSIPFQIQAQVRAYFQTLESDKKYCHESVIKKPFDDLMAEDVFLIPLEDGVGANWESFVASGKVNGTFDRKLTPGSSLTLGVYSSGIKVQHLAAGSYSRPMPTDAEITSSCDFYCGFRDKMGPIRDDGFIQVNPQIDSYWAARGRQDLINACHAAGICSSTSHPALYKLNECRACAVLDLDTGESPVYGQRYCRRLGAYDASQDPWWGIPHNTTAKVGIESLPIRLHVLAQGIQAFYPFATSKESFSRRTLKDLLAKQSLVLE